MFLAIPLESKPTWRNPPWVTVLLILVNFAIFWGPQRTEEKAQDKASAYYFSTQLPSVELPAFVSYLEASSHRDYRTAEKLLQAQQGQALLEMMEASRGFTAKLGTQGGNAEALVPTSSANHAQWAQERSNYAALKPPSFTRKWAQFYDQGLWHAPWTWVTAAFLHASPAHLIGNMLFLFLFGFSVEIGIGRLKYVGFYVLGAVGASVLSTWAYAGSTSYGLGASGAVSTVMVLYAMLYKLRRIKFFYQLLFYFNYIRAPAWILVPMWLANEMILWAVGGTNVSYAAHIGGMLTGIVMAYWMPRQQQLDSALAPAPTHAAPNASALALKAQEQVGKMQWQAACDLWHQAIAIEPHHADYLRRYFNTARLWKNEGHLRHATQAIWQCRSAQAAVLSLQRDCWQWANASHVAVLQGQEPALLAMAQRWAAAGSASTQLDSLLQYLYRPSGPHLALWLDVVERYANMLLKTQQTDAARHWCQHLVQHRPGSGVLEALRLSTT